MHQSLASTAPFTLVASLDATQLFAYREGHRQRAGEEERTPTITDILVFETAAVLRDHPQLNAHYLGDTIAEFHHVDMGIAVDTPKGLLVPVLRHADTLDLPTIATRAEQLTTQARQGTIEPDLLHGSTFTISNMGMLGVETFTPILNTPEVAILGVGAPILRPLENNGQIHNHPSIALSLTVDHQAVDGAPAARFLQDLISHLEHL
jgi:pyruvate dehydrogenase E2 component (dihydrolipoamide acetyltransferase)